MALDLTDIVSDPELGATPVITVTRQNRVTDENGITQLTPYTFNIQGVVSAASGRRLDRLPEYDGVSSGIMIYTTVRLITSADGYTPDQVSWHGKTFIVSAVMDWADDGFYEVTCVATAAQEPAPPY